MTFQRQETTTWQNPQLCALCSCCLSVTASLCGRGCRRARIVLGFLSQKEGLVIIQFQSIMQGKWSGSLHSSLQGCNRMTFAVAQLPAFPSKAAAAAAAARAPELGSAHRPLHALLRSQGLQFHISFKLHINWQLLQSIVWVPILQLHKGQPEGI